LKDFFQSSSDKLRLEIMLKSLSQGDLNLAILGDDEVALSFYARRIFEHLKSQDQVQVDLCLSADSEKLVQRFNQILSELTLDEAMSKNQMAPIRRFMIFPDTQYIQDFDLQLLARLVNGLPASNIHVILLFNLREPYEKKLSVFGKSLIQWVLEKESNHAMGSHGDEAQEGPTYRNDPPMHAPMSAKELKAKSGWSSDVDLTSSSPAPEAGRIEPGLSEAELLQAVHDVESELKRQDALQVDEVGTIQAKPKSSRLGWGLLMGLLLSMGALASMYRDVIMQEVKSMQDYLSTPQWDKSPKKDGAVSVKSAKDDQLPTKDTGPQEVDKPALQAPAAPTQVVKEDADPKVQAPNSLHPGVKVDDSLIPEKEAILSPAKESTATVTPKPQANKDVGKDAVKDLAKPEAALKEPPLKIPVLKDSFPAVTPTLGVKPALVAAPVNEQVSLQKAARPNATPTEALAKQAAVTPAPASTPSPVVVSSKETDSDKPTGKNEWVNALSDKAWVLQLAAMPTKAEILELKGKTPAFEGAQVLLTRNPKSNKPYFILVRGPFASKEEAQGVMQSNAALAKAWLRSAKSLKIQFKTN
jgi:hypothetical protein